MRLSQLWLTCAALALSGEGRDKSQDDDVQWSTTHEHIPEGYNDGSRGGEAVPMGSRAPRHNKCSTAQVWMGRICVSQRVLADQCNSVIEDEMGDILEQIESHCPRGYDCRDLSEPDSNGRLTAHCVPAVAKGPVKGHRAGKLRLPPGEATLVPDHHKQVARLPLHFDPVNARGQAHFEHVVKVHKKLPQAQMVAALVSPHGEILPGHAYSLEARVIGWQHRSWCKWSHKTYLKNVFEGERTCFACVATDHRDLDAGMEVRFRGKTVKYNKADLVYSMVSTEKVRDIK